MRIGLLTSIPETVSAFFVPWITEWRARGHYVSVAAGPSTRRGAVEPMVDTVIAGIGQSPGARLAKAPFALRHWVRENSLDVVLTNTATASAAARLLPLGAPVVYFCHGLHWGPRVSVTDRFYQVVERMLVRRTAAVIVMNQADESWFDSLDRQPPRLALPAGIGLDLSEWQRRVGPVRGDTLDLVWIGMLVDRKRPFDALAVVEGLRRRGVPTTLTMLGAGPLALELAERARPLDDIRLVGHADPRPYLREASALLHTADWEGLSRVLIEATASGVQCFGYATKGVTDCPGVLTVGRQGDTNELADLVQQWWESGAPAPRVDPRLLDWSTALQSVTTLLGRVVDAHAVPGDATHGGGQSCDGRSERDAG